jgi:hypothetical protein
MGRVDDIENLTAFGSVYSQQSTIRNVRAACGSANNPKDQQNKCKSSLPIYPSVYFSQETPLRNSLQDSLASVQISTLPYEDSSDGQDSMKDLFFDGKPIEFKMYHGKEVLI